MDASAVADALKTAPSDRERIAHLTQLIDAKKLDAPIDLLSYLPPVFRVCDTDGTRLRVTSLLRAICTTTMKPISALEPLFLACSGDYGRYGLYFELARYLLPCTQKEAEPVLKLLSPAKAEHIARQLDYRPETAPVKQPCVHTGDSKGTYSIERNGWKISAESAHLFTAHVVSSANPAFLNIDFQDTVISVRDCCKARHAIRRDGTVYACCFQVDFFAHWKYHTVLPSGDDEATMMLGPDCERFIKLHFVNTASAAKHAMIDRFTRPDPPASEPLGPPPPYVPSLPRTTNWCSESFRTRRLEVSSSGEDVVTVTNHKNGSWTIQYGALATYYVTLMDVATDTKRPTDVKGSEFTCGDGALRVICLTDSSHEASRWVVSAMHNHRTYQEYHTGPSVARFLHISNPPDT